MSAQVIPFRQSTGAPRLYPCGSLIVHPTREHDVPIVHIYEASVKGVRPELWVYGLRAVHSTKSGLVCGFDVLHPTGFATRMLAKDATDLLELLHLAGEYATLNAKDAERYGLVITLQHELLIWVCTHRCHITRTALGAIAAL